MVHPAETLPAASYRAGRLATSAPAAGGHDATANWAVTGAILGAGILGLLAIFAETVRSMVYTWSYSDTFGHCFLILPIVGYLVWLRRHDLGRHGPRPCYWAFALLPVLGFGWLLGEVSDSLIVE